MYLDDPERQGYPDAVEIADSARRHGVQDSDMLHCLRNAIREIHQGDRILLLGPATDGIFMEIVVVNPWERRAVIHAMKPVRPKFAAYF